MTTTNVTTGITIHVPGQYSSSRVFGADIHTALERAAVLHPEFAGAVATLRATIDADLTRPWRDQDQIGAERTRPVTAAERRVDAAAALIIGAERTRPVTAAERRVDAAAALIALTRGGDTATAELYVRLAGLAT